MSTKPLIRIVYRPKDDPQGRRHTSWLRWDTTGNPPKDFGVIESVKVFKPGKLPKIKLVKPTPEDMLAAEGILREQCTNPGKCRYDRH